MAVCGHKRSLALKGRKAHAEVVSETVGNPARAEYAKFVRELAMNRVDVVVEVDSCQGAESCVA